MALVGTVLVGFVFGLVLAVPPGPINALIALETVRDGVWAGFKTGGGAMTADGLFCLLAVGIGQLLGGYFGAIEPLLFLAGGVIMLYFGYTALAGVAGAEGTPRQSGSGFQRGFVLSVSNPYQLLFWLTVGLSLVRPGTVDVFAHAPGSLLPEGALIVQTGSVALLGGLFVGIACWVLAYSAAVSLLERTMQRATTVIGGLAGLVLLGTGFFFVGTALDLLVG